MVDTLGDLSAIANFFSSPGERVLATIAVLIVNRSARGRLRIEVEVGGDAREAVEPAAPSSGDGGDE
ncbi:MAG: hypothetical protein ACI9YT_000257 [Halobacteriales archaeon]|jgi:hypothetical protein